MSREILKVYTPPHLKGLSTGELAQIVKDSFVAYRNKCTLICHKCGNEIRYTDYYEKTNKHDVSVKCKNITNGKQCKELMEVIHDDGKHLEEPAFSLLLEKTIPFISKFARSACIRNKDYDMYDEGIELLLKACVAFSEKMSSAKFTTYFWSLLKNKSEELAYHSNRTRRVAHVTCPSCKRKTGSINTAHLLEDFNVFKPLDCPMDVCVLSKKFYTDNGHFEKCPFNGIINGAKCHARLHSDIVDDYGRDNFIDTVGAGNYPNINKKIANCYTVTQRDIIRTQLNNKFKESFPNYRTEGRQVSINDLLPGGSGDKILEMQDFMSSESTIIDDETGISYDSVDDKICIEQISKKCAEIVIAKIDIGEEDQKQLLVVCKCLLSGINFSEITDVCSVDKATIRHWINVVKKDPTVRSLIADLVDMKEIDIIERRDGELQVCEGQLHE